MPLDGKNFGEALNEWIDGAPETGDVPDALVEDAAAASADFLLCALISRIPQDRDGRRPAPAPDPHVPAHFPIWWTGRNTTWEQAARANLLAGIAADFDSVHYLAGGHLSAFLTPVLFARPGTPLDSALRTQALATEFGVRVGQAVKDPVRANGFHVTPVIGGLSVVYALARSRGFPARRIRWCLRLFLSTYRSDYQLLGSDGRLYQMSQAVGQALAVVAQGGAHTRTDERAADEWWRPFSAMGVPPGTPARPSGPWMSQAAPTSLKAMPCCAYFFETLAAVADLRRTVPGRGLRRLHLNVPRYVLAAHRVSGTTAWLEPFDLLHNAAVCWALGRDSWTPLAELPTEAVRRTAALITLHEAADDAPVRATAVLDDGTTVEGDGTGRQRDGRADPYRALRQKAEIVSGRLGQGRPRPDEAADPRQLLRRLLDMSGEDCRPKTAGAPATEGALR
ncbi:hypothetical protein GTU99_11800 [Streptomyces sp. PRKS01-65]|nr:hypothetical protein [Streptomyces harenosi]